jgi:hypothetical protein
MANAVITGASGSLGSSGMGSIMTVLADEFLKVKRNRGHVIKYCNTNGEGVGVPHGTVRFLVPPTGATINDDVDGTSPNYDDSVGTFKDVTLSSHKSVKFGFSQIARTLDGGRSIEPIVASRMADLFNAVEADVAALASTFTNTVGTASVALTEATYDAGRAKLIAAMVPEGDPLFGVYHYNATSWQALAALASFREYRITGRENPNVSGEFGVTPVYWKNAYHIESQNVKFVDTTTDETYNYLMHRDAILVAMKAPEVPMSSGVEAMNFLDPESGIEYQILRYWDKDKDADTLKIHTLYGKSLGRADWGCILLA